MSRTSSLSTALPVDPRPRRILVIEDERHVRALLGDLLTAWGWRVDLAASGRAGLALFDPDLHDVVLTDLGMPEVSGLDVAGAVRERGSGVPVILFTGSPRDLDAEGTRLGFRILYKPLEIGALRRALDQSLTARTV